MIKVAIVEDSRTLREGFETLLNRTPGFQCVRTCETVAEALKKIPGGLPHVVLMDIQLPDANGLECTAKLKEFMPKLQIVIVTVYEDSERIFQSLRAGACGYLLKRDDPERIIAASKRARSSRNGASAVSRDRSAGQLLPIHLPQSQRRLVAIIQHRARLRAVRDEDERRLIQRPRQFLKRQRPSHQIAPYEAPATAGQALSVSDHFWPLPIRFHGPR